jgi:MFS family permease
VRWRRSALDFPPAAYIVFAGVFINRFGSFVMPLLVLYLTRAGFSAAQAGLAVGAYGGGHLMASLIGGHLADRIGRRNTIAVSMFSSAVAMLALSQARHYLPIIALTFLAGCAAEMYRPASIALVTDLVPEERRLMAFGMYRFAVNIGFAAGPATAGFLADRSFFWVFLGDALTSVAYGIIALSFLPHGLRSRAGEEQPAEALRHAARDRNLLVFLFATVFVTMVLFQFSSTLALYIQSLGFAPHVYGVLISFNGVLIVCCELLITAFVKRFRPLPVVATGYFLCGLGFALTGLSHSVAALAGTIVIWTLGEMVSSPMASTYIAGLAPVRYRGRYMGFLSVSWSVGMLLGPPLGTLLFARDPGLLWTLCGVLGTFAAATLLVRSRTITS